MGVLCPCRILTFYLYYVCIYCDDDFDKSTQPRLQWDVIHKRKQLCELDFLIFWNAELCVNSPNYANQVKKYIHAQKMP